jgi:hypothetical protein
VSVPQFDAVVDGIVATLQAYAGLGGPGGAGVPVYDGPVPTDEPVMSFIAIGWDGDDQSTSPQIRFPSEWHDMGPSATRDEDIEVDCFLVVQDGSNDFATLRTQAATNLGLVSSALRAIPALGVAAVLWCELAVAEARQGVSSQGAFVAVPFTIRTRTNI